MSGAQLKLARKQSKKTQARAARELGVTQAYLSMLEKGLRPLSEGLQEKAVRSFDLPPTEVPIGSDMEVVRPTTDDQLAADLATLGYKGFSYLKPSRRKNPAVVLLSALLADNREARLVEALPWVVLTYPDLDWNALVRSAKMHDLQNRLGYITNVARRVAEFRKDARTAALLTKREGGLDSSRLLKEDTLCRSSITQAERHWLKVNRPEAARHWRLLTDLTAKSMNYYV